MNRSPRQALAITLLVTILSQALFAQPTLPPRPPAQPEQMETATFLGVELAKAPRVLTAQLGIPVGFGLVVVGVRTDSPASKAGLQTDDILLRFNDQKLVEPTQLSALVRAEKSGTEVTVTFLRAGTERSEKVTLAERQVPVARPQGMSPQPGMPPFGGFNDFFGMDPFSGGEEGGGLTAPNATRREDVHAAPPPSPAEGPSQSGNPPAKNDQP